MGLGRLWGDVGSFLGLGRLWGFASTLGLWLDLGASARPWVVAGAVAFGSAVLFNPTNDRAEKQQVGDLSTTGGAPSQRGWAPTVLGWSGLGPSGELGGGGGERDGSFLNTLTSVSDFRVNSQKWVVLRRSQKCTGARNAG